MIFSLAFGLLHWADENTGLSYGLLQKYLSLRSLPWNTESYVAFNIADWLVRSFVCSPAILIGLTFYEHCTAGMPRFSIRSILTATSFIAVLLAIGAADQRVISERWIAALALSVVIAASTSYLAWSLVRKKAPAGPLAP